MQSAIRIRRAVQRRLRPKPRRPGEGDPQAALGGVSPGLEPRRPPGTARASMFFDEHPRFYETSDTAAHRGRLNLRYEAIFAENREVFEGARVLDIASHDGRWSLAALKTGATEVVGIEAREELVQAANENLERYGGTRPYRFVAGDVFDVLARERFGADSSSASGSSTTRSATTSSWPGSGR